MVDGEFVVWSDGMGFCYENDLAKVRLMFSSELGIRKGYLIWNKTERFGKTKFFRTAYLIQLF